MQCDQLPGDAALLHSVAMIERAAEHEADLVIAWPGVGVAVVEVKGGHVSRHYGQWYQSSGRDTRPVRDPVVQAQDCMHVLHRLLVQYGSEAAATRSAHLVTFIGFRNFIVALVLAVMAEPAPFADQEPA